MPANINREELLSRLQSLQPGLSSREIVEQSTCFVFQAGRILTYNDEVMCSTASKLGKEFKGAVQAKPLLDLLGKLPEDELGIEFSESELVITGVKKKAGIRLEQEILLGVANVEKPETWEVLPEDFDDAIGIVSTCASNDSSKFSLTCVHFTPRWMEACDNFQLIRYKLKMALPENTLVRSESLKHLRILGMTHFALTQAWMHFKNPNGLTLSCRRYMEEFPDLGKMLEVSGSPTTLPGGLAEAVQKAEIFSADNPDDNKVVVELRQGKMRILGQGSHGWFTETKNLKYDGEPMKFCIAPKLLVDISNRHNDCEMTSTRLKVNGGKFVYVSCLSKVAEKED